MADQDRSTPPRIGIVLVNWNGWRDTLACVESLRASRYRDFGIFVVDNASGDNSIELLAPLEPEIVLVRSSVNGGWAGGCNLGMRAALQAGAEFIYLLNNDAQVLPDTLGALIAAVGAAPAEYGFFGSMVDHDPPTEHYSFSGASEDPVTRVPGNLAHRRDDPALDAALLDTAYVQGSALFVHRSVIQKIGMLDERFFLNYDETDWCYRGRARGFKCAMVPGSVVLHKVSGSIGGVRSPLNHYFSRRNELLFVEKHLGWRLWLQSVLWTSAAVYRMARVEGRHPLLALLAPRDLLLRANVRALRDYFLRQFGDCPPEIRHLHAEFRKQRAKA